MTVLSWHWSEVRFTTEVPEEEGIVTSLNDLCLCSAMVVPADFYMPHLWISNRHWLKLHYLSRDLNIPLHHCS